MKDKSSAMLLGGEAVQFEIVTCSIVKQEGLFRSAKRPLRVV